MYWHPETEKELAEAKRFYEDARDFDPQAPKRRAAPVRKIGARQKALIAAILDKLDDDAPRLAPTPTGCTPKAAPRASSFAFGVSPTGWVSPTRASRP